MAHTTAKILVVEDDRKIAFGLTRGLEQHNFHVRCASDGERGLALIFEWEPDLVVLDLMLPGVDGMEILTRCQARTSVPFIVLTAHSELDTRLRSFELGAIDFLSKPFWLEELIARIRLRLSLDSPTPSKNIITWSDVTLDIEARRVLHKDQDINLTPHELNILVYLARRPGRALSRQQIATGALSMDTEVSDRTVDSHVARLRKKLGDPAHHAIATVWGIGYRFEVPS